MLALIKFKIHDDLRFLSHAETVRLFQRACVRAELTMVYSQGFNPRAKLSLPLPRTVGVESDEDMLCLHVKEPTVDAERLRKSLSEQLPDGCQLLEVSFAKTGASLQPCLATYVLGVRQRYVDEKLRSLTKELLASEKLFVLRSGGGGGLRRGRKKPARNVDVRPFLKSIEFCDNDIVVECGVTPSGSIRVDEILKLLGLDIEKRSGPIRRANVQWQCN